MPPIAPKSDADADAVTPAPKSGPDALPQEHFYREGPYVVFTAAYHLARGYCCGSGCRHCPYGNGEPSLAQV